MQFIRRIFPANISLWEFCENRRDLWWAIDTLDYDTDKLSARCESFWIWWLSVVSSIQPVHLCCNAAELCWESGSLERRLSIWVMPHFWVLIMGQNKIVKRNSTGIPFRYIPTTTIIDRWAACMSWAENISGRTYENGLAAEKNSNNLIALRLYDLSSK